MSRSFPADTKMQNFFTEQYIKENNTRLDFYTARKKKGGEGPRFQKAGMSGTFGISREKSAPIFGLPKINPMVFARDTKRAEDAEIERIRTEARKKNTLEEMRPPQRALKSKLYDGFTKEEKGRYQYLKARNVVIPEKKYSFPVLSSWDYGWKLNTIDTCRRPTHARTCKIKDTFYTRNGVPDLYPPAIGMGNMERSKTVIL